MGLLDEAKGFVTSNKRTLIAGAGGLAAGSVLGAGAVAFASRKKARKKRRSSSYYKRKRSYKRKGQRRPHTAGKRKDRSKRRIRYTKNNQPYVILASGKARFISKRSARVSRRRKGGRY